VDLRIPAVVGLCANLLAPGCAFKNPNYDGAEAETRTTGSASDATLSGSQTGPLTTEAPTTETPTTDAGSDTTVDPPSTTGDTTVDPSQTETEGETTTSTSEGSSSTADTEGFVCEVPEPNDSLSIDLRLYATNELWLGLCVGQLPPSAGRVSWDNELMMLTPCDDNCDNCDPEPYFTVEMNAPVEDLELLPNQDSLFNQTCVAFQFDTRKPFDGVQCTASSFVILDAGGPNKPRFVMVDGQWHKPKGLPEGVNWTLEDDDVCYECDDCCDPHLAGTYGFSFEGNFDQDLLPLYPQQDPIEIYFFGHAGVLKAYDAVIDLECKPHFEFILNTL